VGITVGDPTSDWSVHPFFRVVPLITQTATGVMEANEYAGCEFPVVQVPPISYPPGGMPPMPFH